MEPLSKFFAALPQLAPSLTVVVATILIVWAVNRLVFARFRRLAESRFTRQIAILALGAIGIIAAVLVLPVSEETRQHLLSLFGLLLTAIIALSSTTLVSNAMAGVILRAVRSFRAGDFVRVGDHFGRVTEKGLFHTEIQTANRDLVTLPNAYLVANPMTVVRNSGTIVSTTVSLGYDVHHAEAETLLLRAAGEAELAEPFVQILELGNFSVTYRVAGFLADLKRLVMARTHLNRAVLERLHGAGIEIASPTLMTQRQLAPGRHIVPVAQYAETSPEENTAPGDLIFDKAEAAEHRERLAQERVILKQRIATMEESLRKADDSDRPRLELRIRDIQRRLEAIESVLAARENPPDPDQR